MRILLSTAVLFLAACAATPPVLQRPSSNERFPDGVWSGSLEILPTRSGDTSVAKPHNIIVAGCSGDVRAWYQLNDGSYETPRPRFTVESRLGSYAVRFFDNENTENPDWVEIQSLLLIALHNGEFRAHWSRAVNNRLTPDDAKSRWFFQHGIGVLKQVSNECEPGRVYPFGVPSSP